MAAYNLHIKRENEILDSEWLAICAQDKTLTVQHVAIAINPQTGKKVEISTPNSCVWTSPASSNKYYFSWSNGRITFGSDEIQVNKAKEIAKLLKAKVVGDEGEEY